MKEIFRSSSVAGAGKTDAQGSKGGLFERSPDLISMSGLREKTSCETFQPSRISDDDYVLAGGITASSKTQESEGLRKKESSTVIRRRSDLFPIYTKVWVLHSFDVAAEKSLRRKKTRND
jgi:hypothetical protein